ncbi:hypothetical protein J3459_010490 [Metarhizium acridum]|uniref:uncharacterized protein n=1 Tax=Metarhizium acridum TaxID=92637 RepID=UPI001C6B18AB|nr:hypothetical protein J3458_020017 [Metarhizium acridum]KAG8422339.1 hypothetical protein J3459_010490 [Metarhizium acridum]
MQDQHEQQAVRLRMTRDHVVHAGVDDGTVARSGRTRSDSDSSVLQRLPASRGVQWVTRGAEYVWHIRDASQHVHLCRVAAELHFSIGKGIDPAQGRPIRGKGARVG